MYLAIEYSTCKLTDLHEGLENNAFNPLLKPAQLAHMQQMNVLYSTALGKKFQSSI